VYAVKALTAGDSVSLSVNRILSHCHCPKSAYIISDMC